MGPGRPVGQNGGGAFLSFQPRKKSSAEPAPSAALLGWWQAWPLLAGRCCGAAFVCLNLSHHAARTDE